MLLQDGRDTLSGIQFEGMIELPFFLSPGQGGQYLSMRMFLGESLFQTLPGRLPVLSPGCGREEKELLVDT